MQRIYEGKKVKKYECAMLVCMNGKISMSLREKLHGRDMRCGVQEQNK